MASQNPINDNGAQNKSLLAADGETDSETRRIHSRTRGSVNATVVEIVDGSGNQVTSFGASNNVVSTLNSSTTPLGGNASFTGTYEDVSAYRSVVVTVTTDQASSSNGIIVYFSPDGTNNDNSFTKSVSASTPSNFVVPVVNKFMKVVYENGSVAQSSFRLQTLFEPFAPSLQQTNTASDGTSTSTSAVDVRAKPQNFNGTTWDRQRSVVNGQDSVGTGIQAAGLIAQFDDVSPGTVTENQFAPLRMNSARQIYVDTELPAAAALADGVSPTNIEPRVAADMQGLRSDGTANSDRAILSKTFDMDTGANTESNVGVTLRKSASGGSTEYGTLASPFQVLNQPISGTALVTYAARITTNATTTPTSSTAYISTISITTETAGTTSTIIIRDKSGTPLVLVPSAVTTVAAITTYNFQSPIKMTSGIDIVTAGAVAATVDVWISYYQ